MKKLLLSLLVLTFMILAAEEGNAQRRGKKKRRVKEDTSQEDIRSRRDNDDYDDYNSSSIMNKLNFEIKPGNLFISSVTSLSLKANVGYKFNNTFSAGLGGKYFYQWQSGLGGYSDYGAFLYGRAKVSKEFYLVGEYNTLSLGNFSSVRGSVTYPAAGIGYMRPGIDWSSGFELLFVFSEDARNALQIPLEYWLNISYNF